MLDAASFLSVSLDTSKLQSVLEKVSSQQEASAARVEALEKGLESTTARAVAAETAAEAATQRASRAEECVQKLEAQVAALDIKVRRPQIIVHAVKFDTALVCNMIEDLSCNSASG